MNEKQDEISKALPLLQPDNFKEQKEQTALDNPTELLSLNFKPKTEDSPGMAAVKLLPPTVRQTSVYFNQVFKLKSNNTFPDLYRECFRSSQGSQGASQALMERDKYIQNQIQLIDTRPRRWYLQLDEIKNQIDQLKSDLEVYKQNISGLQEAIKQIAVVERFTSKKKDYADLSQFCSDQQALQQIVKNSMNTLEDEKKKIIYEISAAGYIYQEENGNAKIIQPVPQQMPKAPLDLSNAIIDSDNIWEGFSKKLNDALFADSNKLITSPNKQNEFQQGLVDLKSVGSCATIITYVANINNQLTTLQQNSKNLQNALDNDADKVIQSANENCNQLIRKCDEAIATYNQAIASARESATQAMAQMFPAMRTPETFLMLTNAYLAKINPSYTLDTLQVWINNFETLKRKYSADRDSAAANYREGLREKIKECDANISTLQAQLDAYDKNKILMTERTNFLLYWNNPNIYDATINEKTISVDIDPLQNYYDTLNRASIDQRKTIKVNRFNFEGDDYYNEEQQSLRRFMELPNLNDQIAVFPYIDQNGQPSSEVYRFIKGPRKPTAFEPHDPIIKFVETHEAVITWEGYSLSKLICSINLPPGEEKEIIVQTQTKITRTATQSMSKSSEEKLNMTSSFEDNLTNELSNSFNLTESDENARRFKLDQSNNNRYASMNENSSTSNRSAKASAKGGIGSFSVNGEASYSSTQSKKSSEQKSIEAAVAISQSEDSQILTKNTRDMNTKNMLSRISKVANETSSYNKLELASTTSETVDEETSNKETMRFKNPNQGRAINYNLFQLQNVYKTSTNLKDVKILVNTGIELAEGTDILDTKVYDLENFNKIYKDTNKSDFLVLLCALIARRVLKNYTNLLTPGAENAGILKVKTTEADNEAVIFADLVVLMTKLDLCFSKGNDGSKTKDNNAPPPQASLSEKIADLKISLFNLQKFTFIFNSNYKLSESQQVVNTAACHMDSQLGLNEATEDYLEKRRQLTIEKEKAQIEIMRSYAKNLPNMKPHIDIVSPVTFFNDDDKNLPKDIEPISDNNNIKSMN